MLAGSFILLELIVAIGRSWFVDVTAMWEWLNTNMFCQNTDWLVVHLLAGTWWTQRWSLSSFMARTMIQIPLLTVSLKKLKSTS